MMRSKFWKRMVWGSVIGSVLGAIMGPMAKPQRKPLVMRGAEAIKSLLKK